MNHTPFPITYWVSPPPELARYREVALDNRTRRALGKPMLGQIFAMDPDAWARPE